MKVTFNQVLPEPKQEPIKDKTHILSCNSCNSKLVEIKEILDIPEPQKFKAVCFCGGSSFLLKLEGKAFTIAVPPLIIEDIEFNFFSDNPIVIKCKKNKK